MQDQSTSHSVGKCFPTENLNGTKYQPGNTYEQGFHQYLGQGFTTSRTRLSSPKFFQRISIYILLLAWGALVPCAPVFSADVSVSWNPNSESDLAGYKIYKRTLPSQDFGQPIFSGMPSNPSSPSITVTGLATGTTYGFISTAFDTSGNESAPSVEKQITLTTSPPPPTTTPSPLARNGWVV
ncbi:MAG TPA: fibronectin type III domain-containing protein, partial [Nitrospirales bacterium]|nr:fibronectin type III domain-containing protein [Nitrospirales bacterium]